MTTCEIIGTGSYVPKQIITNDDLAKYVETNDEWIISRTGIKERHISSEEAEGTTFMSAQAAKNALENANVSAVEIDLVLVGTSSPEKCFPSTACEVQGILKAKNAVAFDISAACSGFVFALASAQAFIKAGIYKTILVIGADALSKLVDWQDRSTCILFGDGAGAVVVRASERGLIHLLMKSDGEKGDVLSCLARSNNNFTMKKEPQLGYIKMNGQEVFKFAVKEVSNSITQLLQEADLTIEDIDHIILHQANYRIVESIAKRLKQPICKFPMNIGQFGNTSAGSIPLLLDEMNRNERLQKGQKVILAGFGGGLTWGAIVLEW